MRKEVKVDPVDVNNDAEMVSLGIRKPMVRQRDPFVWTKSEKERKAWKKHRHFPAPNMNWGAPAKVSRFCGRLTVNVRGLDKTTFSYYCLESDVQYLLSKYKKDNCAIVRAFWNGREVNPDCVFKRTA